MGKNSEQLLREIYQIARKIVEEEKRNVEEILSNLRIGFEEYRELVVQEILEDYYVKVLFVDSHLPAYTVEELKKSAEHLTHQKIARDKRIFAPRGEKK